MALSRRDFCFWSGATAASLLLPSGLVRASESPQIFTPLDIGPSQTLRATARPAFTEALPKYDRDIQGSLNSVLDTRYARLIGPTPKHWTTQIDAASMTKCLLFMVVQDAIEAGADMSGKDFGPKTHLDYAYQWIDDRWSRKRRKMYEHIEDLDNRDLIVDDGLKYLMGRSVNPIARNLCNALVGKVATSDKEQFVMEMQVVEWMNQKARQIGMKNTAFINSNGLPGHDKNYKRMDPSLDGLSNTTTLEDLSIMTAVMVRDYPQYKKYTDSEFEISLESRRKFSENHTYLRQAGPRATMSNPLYRYDDYFNIAQEIGIDGLKTGTTDKGEGLIATSHKDGFSVATVSVLHPPKRYAKDRYRERPDQAIENILKGKKALIHGAKIQSQFEKEQDAILNIFDGPA